MDVEEREEGRGISARTFVDVCPHLSSHGHLSEGEWSYSRTEVRLHLEAEGHLHSCSIGGPWYDWKKLCTDIKLYTFITRQIRTFDLIKSYETFE